MKKFKLILTLLVTGFLTMNMGFPTDLASDRDDSKHCPTVTESPVIVMTSAYPIRKTGYSKAVSVQELSFPCDYSTITIKVFDAKGNLVMNQQVEMDKFLGKQEELSLPAGSTFVMFRENIAYYFLEAGLIY